MSMAAFRILPGRDRRIKRDGHTFHHSRYFPLWKDPRVVVHTNVRRQEARFIEQAIAEAQEELTMKRPVIVAPEVASLAGAINFDLAVEAEVPPRTSNRWSDNPIERGKSAIRLIDRVISRVIHSR